MFPKPVILVNKMVATEQIPIMFHGRGIAAGLRKNAQARLFPRPVGQCNIENLNEDPSNILSDPFIKYRVQEITVLAGSTDQSVTLAFLG